MRAHARGKIHRRRNSKEERDEREVGVRACVHIRDQDREPRSHRETQIIAAVFLQYRLFDQK